VGHVPGHGGGLAKAPTEGRISWLFTVIPVWGTTPFPLGMRAFVDEQLPRSWIGC
jgi:hypothetical protein